MRSIPLVALSLFAAACGGSSATSQQTTPPPEPPAPEPVAAEPAPEPAPAPPPEPGLPLEVGPDIYKLVHEDENVRVYEVTFAPAAKIGMHKHPDHVAYVIAGGQLSVAGADAPQVFDLQAGSALFLPAQAHSAENVGPTEVKLAVFDLLKPSGAAAPDGKDAVKVGPKSYKPLFENERVRVLELTFKPKTKIAAHAHPDHVGYFVSGGKAKIKPGAGAAQDVEVQAGQAMFMPAGVHSAQNVGKTEIKGIIVELKPGEASP